MARHTRATAAIIAMLALLFSQFALSAIACPGVSTAAAEQAAADHCAKTANKNVCERHCDFGASNVGHAAPDAAPNVLALALPWRAPALQPSSGLAGIPRACEVSNHSPPPRTLFGALRL